ncbi:MAG: hypothetical protein KDN22_32005 [Verrucomicrobiae bacterium]|nr:hypothetical protein [Verrucomicrobiae bacterium]
MIEKMGHKIVAAGRHSEATDGDMDSVCFVTTKAGAMYLWFRWLGDQSKTASFAKVNFVRGVSPAKELQQSLRRLSQKYPTARMVMEVGSHSLWISRFLVGQQMEGKTTDSVTRKHVHGTYPERSLSLLCLDLLREG